MIFLMLNMDRSTESVNSMNLSANEDENNAEFQIRPPIEKRFPKDLVKEIIHAVLVEELNNKQYKANEMENLTKSIAVALRGRLRGNVDSSYKLVNHVILGEQRGAGVKTVARTIWDSANDAIASMSYENESLFCVATVFGVYFY